MLELNTEFKIGDVLKPKIDNTNKIRLHVVEVKTITCVAGTQTLYGCRVYASAYKKDPPAITLSLTFFNEVEVEKWKEDKPAE